MTTTPPSGTRRHFGHPFVGIGDANQLNPLFARPGESTAFPLNTLPSGE